MSYLVPMAVGMVTNALDDKTRQVARRTSAFHLISDHVVLPSDSVAVLAGFHDRACRANSANMYLRRWTF